MASTIRGSDNFDSAYKMTMGTAQNSTSGTSIDFTGIPSWVKRITVMFNGVSTNGTSIPLLQLGAGSVQTTSYFGQSSAMANITSTTSSTAGFPVYSILAANTIAGSVAFSNIGSNTWVCSGVVTDKTNSTITSSGAVTLSGTLDRIRITTVNGTDTFDAGTINIMYEG